MIARLGSHSVVSASEEIPSFEPVREEQGCSLKVLQTSTWRCSHAMLMRLCTHDYPLELLSRLPTASKTLSALVLKHIYRCNHLPPTVQDSLLVITIEARPGVKFWDNSPATWSQDCDRKARRIGAARRPPLRSPLPSGR